MKKKRLVTLFDKNKKKIKQFNVVSTANLGKVRLSSYFKNKKVESVVWNIQHGIKELSRTNFEKHYLKK